MAFPSLTTQQQRKIEKLVRGWNTKLTWAFLVSRIYAEFDITTTRQTLNTYKGIKNEYDLKKIELRGASPELKRSITKKDVNLYNENNQLRNEIKRLESVNANHLRLIERVFIKLQSHPNIDLNELVSLLPEESK